MSAEIVTSSVFKGYYHWYLIELYLLKNKFNSIFVNNMEPVLEEKTDL